MPNMPYITIKQRNFENSRCNVTFSCINKHNMGNLLNFFLHYQA
jgi:hypothetical protein